jgi:hypothetical protein
MKTVNALTVFDISDDEIGLAHCHPGMFGAELKWSGSDTSEQFEKNIKDPDRYQLLKSYGWLDPDVITYKYNRYGFRCDEFDDRPAGIALGCSHTEGVGVREQDVWSSVLSKLLGVHVWNFGVGGSSLDTVFRLLDYWLPKLTPKFVAICIPVVARMEVFGGKDINGQDKPINLGHWPSTVERYNPFYREWTVSDANMIMLKRKNLLAIQQLCNKANTALVVKESAAIIAANMSEVRPCARDLMHPGAKNHAYFAQHMYNALPTEIKK